MKRVAVIMAGGGGTRFWPLSRQALPKQMIAITSDNILINETIDHYDTVVSREDTFIVTKQEQIELMSVLVYPEVNRANILSEPIGRNTAPCILYAALTLQKMYGDTLMAVLPSDHFITDLKEFRRILKLAFETAENTDKMVTIGLWPTYPAVGFGYIRFSGNSQGDEAAEVYKLQRFVEKPNLMRAKEYVSSERYLWNSGMYVWKTSVILDAYKTYMPELYEKLNGIYDKLRTPDEKEVLDALYPELESISIDYGIMENAADILVIPAEFGWNDVGSWDSLSEVLGLDDRDNVIRANHLGIDTEKCIVFSSGERLIATVGVKDLIIVDTGDAILICNKDKAQNVKDVVEELSRRKRSDLL